MKTDQEPDVWTLLAPVALMPEKLGKNIWGVRVGRTQWQSGAICTCVETGGVFTAEIAGRLDSTGAASGNALLRFKLVEGDARLEAGFHMRLGR